MAFISSDGSVKEKKPFGVGTIVAFFLAFIDFIIYFFKTLFGMAPEKTNSTRGGHVATARYNANSGGGASWYNGGTGGNSGSKPSGGNGGGNSGVGRNVNSMSSLGVNTNFSSCPGGMCGSGPSI